ncbi:MAG TPA: tetratricopeptide repeat protein [Deltaproteobacteria bacterium]|nr:tetratricopeptide repeat protein [Deltaproteobacteria bacterium]
MNERSASADLKNDILVVISLIICILIIYWQVGGFPFISLDDPEYITRNGYVQMGLSKEGVSWAFSLSQQGTSTYWHPLTWLSHMMDCQLFGLHAGMHHLHNVLIHMVNTILLFLALRLMTGSPWRSAFVASLFAVHPVNVDSVAWIAERKNLLSTMFMMLSFITYFLYTRKRSVAWYVATCVLFCLGLLAKQMIMTLPFVLLLMDYWPLGRIRFPEIREGRKDWPSFFHDVGRLVIEKIPLIIIMGGFILITIFSLTHTETIRASQLTTMDLKLKNAIVSYVMYMGKMIWPAGLTVFHPFPDMIPMWKVLGASAVILAVTTVAMITTRKYPYFIVGWLWFLGTLVPVIGIVQAGLWPAIAERWAYVPYIGLFIVMAWGGGDILRAVPCRERFLKVSCVLVILVLAFLSWRQTGYWKNDFTLFSHSLAVDPDNYVAHVNLGNAYAMQDDYKQAAVHYQDALRIHRSDVLALNNLGKLSTKLGDKDRAIRYYSEALRYEPEDSTAHYELGSLYAERGALDEAIGHFSSVIRGDPSNALAYYNMGVLTAKKGDSIGAEGYLSSAVQLAPQDPEARFAYGMVLVNNGKISDAIEQLDQVLALKPEFADAQGCRELALRYMQKVRMEIADLGRKKAESAIDPAVLLKLGVLYSSIGENMKALDALFTLVKHNPGNAEAYYNIACIYARQGNTEESIGWLKKSINAGFKNWELLKKDPDLKNIRPSSYYKDLMGTIPEA